MSLKGPQVRSGMFPGRVISETSRNHQFQAIIWSCPHGRLYGRALLQKVARGHNVIEGYEEFHFRFSYGNGFVVASVVLFQKKFSHNKWRPSCTGNGVTDQSSIPILSLTAFTFPHHLHLPQLQRRARYSFSAIDEQSNLLRSLVGGGLDSGTLSVSGERVVNHSATVPLVILLNLRKACGNIHITSRKYYTTNIAK